MEALSCLIIEDDAVSSKLLTKMCNANKMLELTNTCTTGSEAISKLIKQPTDLIFLDIELPDMKGWDLIPQLHYSPIIIVTTAHRNYAFEAFEHKVNAFLQKPIEQANFDAAILCAIERFHHTSRAQTQDHIFIKNEGKFIKLLFMDISHIENIADYIKIFTKAKTYTIYCTLKYLYQRLPNYFVKTHRSFIINSYHILEIEEDCLHTSSHTIPIARAQKREIIEKLNLL